MKTIYKYQFKITSEVQEFSIKGGYQVLHAGLDPTGVPCLWVAVDLEKSNECPVAIQVVGTGGTIPQEQINQHPTYLNSFVDRVYVWHIWLV